MVTFDALICRGYYMYGRVCRTGYMHNNFYFSNTISFFRPLSACLFSLSAMGLANKDAYTYHPEITS